jgi:CDP-diacylglycerol---serine O-phosphatidyltransferase
MNKILKLIPNILTSINLVCGFIAIAYSLDINTLYFAPFFILLAACFDFLDGLTARMFKAYSEFGKQLDSLADMVSFGVAPGIMMYQLFHLLSNRMFVYNEHSQITFILISAIIPVFSALRLAKFNTDERQMESFMGLPTPATALFIASLTFVAFETPDYKLQYFILNSHMLLGIVIVISLLMISEIPMFSMKMKNFSIKDNLVRYIFLALCIVLFLTVNYLALPLFIVLYVIISLVVYTVNFIKLKIKKA